MATYHSHAARTRPAQASSDGTLPVAPPSTWDATTPTGNSHPSGRYPSPPPQRRPKWWTVLVLAIIVSPSTGQEPPTRHPAAQPAAEAHGKEPPSPQVSLTAEQRIESALDRPVQLEFVETPLTDAVTFLADHHKIPIALDSRALQDNGVPEDLPVTFSLEGAKLRTALRLLLHKHDLSWIIRDEALVITTRDAADNLSIVGVHPVHDLLADDIDAEALIEVIKTTIRPESWPDAGGPPPIWYLRGSLVFEQMPEVHRESDQLLQAIRRARAQKQAADEGNRYAPVPLGDLKLAESWNKRLSSKLNLEFVETPLADVLRFLQDKTAGHYLLDERALEESAIPFDLPITFVQENVSLQAALSAMLRQHDLNWSIRDEVLLVTTQETAANHLETRVYPVGDLQPVEDDADDELEYVLRGAVRPDRWDQSGGPGAVSRLGTRLLVVVQTRQIHDEIEHMFAQIRRHAPPAGNRPQSVAPDRGR